MERYDNDDRDKSNYVALFGFSSQEFLDAKIKTIISSIEIFTVRELPVNVLMESITPVSTENYEPDQRDKLKLLALSGFVGLSGF